MMTWPDPERLLIARYLADLGLRSKNSRTYYKQVLHSFQDVAARHVDFVGEGQGDGLTGLRSLQVAAHDDDPFHV